MKSRSRMGSPLTNGLNLAFWVGFACVVSACDKKSDGASSVSSTTKTPPDSGPRVEPVGVSGQLSRSGVAVPLDPEHVQWSATSCSETEETQVSVHFVIPAEKSAMHVEEKLVDIHVDTDRVFLGSKVVLATDDQFRAGQEPTDVAVRVLGWVSANGKPAVVRMPYEGWVRVNKVNRKGPVDLSFDINFGSDNGRLAGRLTFDTVTPVVCRIPAAPPPRAP